MRANHPLELPAADAGLEALATAYATTHVASMGYAYQDADNGEVTVTFNDIGGDVAAGANTIVFAGVGSATGVAWTCDNSVGNAGNLAAKYKPANCR